MTESIVIVDLDDCLIPDGTAARAAVAAVLDELSIVADEQAVDTVFAAARGEWRGNPHVTHRGVERVASWEALRADLHELPMPEAALPRCRVRFGLTARPPRAVARDGRLPFAPAREAAAVRPRRTVPARVRLG
ncbi:hypothetical protein [Lentzea californiensis]|uniref:hypothetical protein n=1 Tax=Lentzea californiensis TaxID=438851 RepID=UPI002165C2F2|nr:hypothetical protein [Lentzea californiensis]MCR3750195.1 hypothetical protein [Lentzea californiensis]